MRQKTKAIFYLSFIATISYTTYGIFQLGKQGGPCNGGLAIIVMIPFFAVCSGLLISTFSDLTDPNRTNYNKSVFLATVSLLIWSYWFFTFFEDSIKDSILYLGLFELFNTFILMLSVRRHLILAK